MERARLDRLWCILALVVGLGSAWLHPGEGAGLGASIDGKLLDLRFQWRGAATSPSEVAIVALDDRTITALGRFPVPRRDLARAIDAILAAGAGALAIDLLFLEREAPHDGIVLSPGDRLLLDVLSRSERVVLAAAGAVGDTAATDDMMWLASANAFGAVSADRGIARDHARMPLLLAPIQEFARLAGIGVVNVAPGPDGALRRVPVAVEIAEGPFLPSLPLEALRRQRGIDRAAMKLQLGIGIDLGGTHIPADYPATVGINFLGPRGTVPTYSLVDALEGNLPSDALRGRIVFIGATAIGFGDIFESPFSSELPGVEALATVAQNLAEGRILRRDGMTWSVDMALGASLAVLAFFAANNALLPVSGALYAGIWLLGAIGAQFLFQRHHLWIDGSAIILTLATIGAGVYGARFVLQRRMAGQLRRQRDNLAAYQSPLLAEWLASSDSPGFAGRTQFASILFADLSGFSQRSQALGPRATAEFLSDLHRLFERNALAHGGVIEQFAGDGVMIVFGLPRPRPIDAVEALLCARDMIRDIGAWPQDERWASNGALSLRAGLHSGPVMVAKLGGERQAHVTVSGDTVNVASRLLDIAKRESMAIAATADFAAAVAAAGRSDLLSGHRAILGEVLRGRSGPIDLVIMN